MSERVRTSIVIGGINTAEPCHTVTDGAMADVLNLRYKNGAFVNVHQPEIVTPITTDDSYKIIYAMEYLGTKYIAVKGRVLHHVGVDSAGTVFSIQAIVTLEVSYRNLKLYNFGSALYATYDSSAGMKELCFIYKDDKFTPFDMNALPPLEIEIDCDYKLAPNTGHRPFDVDGTLLVRCNMKSIGAMPIVEEKLFEYNLAREYLQGLGCILGDFQIMVVYRLFDGTLIKPGRAHYITSFRNINDKDTLVRLRYHENNNDTFELYYYDKIYGVKPTVRLTTAPQLNDIVKEVVILSTRPELMYDYDKVHEKYGNPLVDDKILKKPRTVIYYNDKKLSQMPYYEVAKFEDGQTSRALNYDDHYDSIENEDIVSPSYSLHNIVSRGKYEYNSRLHSFGIELSLFKGFNISAPNNISGEYFASGFIKTNIETTINTATELLIDGKTYWIQNSFTVKYFKGVRADYYIPISNLVQYPDMRAKRVCIYGGNSVNGYIYCDVKLEKAAENNVGWAFISKMDRRRSHVFVDDYVLFPTQSLAVKPPNSDLSVMIKQFNKLYVSEMNNPFFVSPANIYTIGDSASVIDGINTATEQITETKFGQFPLYVFSDRAIHALEVGSGEILYQRVIGISNETKLPGTATVGAANLIFFISQRGVMAIEGRKIFCVSETLESYAGLVLPLVLFRDYLKGAALRYNPIEAELIVYNTGYEYAYVYSLRWKLWSRRDWVSRDIGSQTKIYIDGKGVASAWDEDLSKPVLSCLLESRAVKLGSLEFKRLETLVARLICGEESDYEIRLWGSNDLRSWQSLNAAESQPLIRRTSASYKFFKVKIDCSCRDYFAITNLDTEHYLRFVRRLR